MESRPRMLVVEDDVELSTVLSRTAARACRGVDIDWADGLPSACDQLRSAHYDAVLADYLLGPFERGHVLYGICTRYQPHATFALMSAQPIEQLMAIAPEAHLPLLSKPFTAREWTDFVSSLLERTSERSAR